MHNDELAPTLCDTSDEEAHVDATQMAVDQSSPFRARLEDGIGQAFYYIWVSLYLGIKNIQCRRFRSHS